MRATHAINNIYKLISFLKLITAMDDSVVFTHSAVLGSNVNLSPRWQMDPGKIPLSLLGPVDSSGILQSMSLTRTRFHRIGSSTSSRHYRLLFDPRSTRFVRHLSATAGRRLRSIAQVPRPHQVVLLDRWTLIPFGFSSLEFITWNPILHFAAMFHDAVSLDARICCQSSVGHPCLNSLHHCTKAVCFRCLTRQCGVYHCRVRPTSVETALSRFYGGSVKGFVIQTRSISRRIGSSVSSILLRHH